MRCFFQNLLQLLEIDGLGQDGDRAGVSRVVSRRPGGHKDDAGRRVSRNNMAAGGGAIEFRHPIIHQHDIGLVTVVGLDRFETGPNHFYDLMLAMSDEGGQGCPHVSLVVGNENAHAELAEPFMPKAETDFGSGSFYDAAGRVSRAVTSPRRLDRTAG